MKRRLTRAVLLVSCFATASAHAAEKLCTSASLEGTYGFLRIGQSAQGSITALGWITFDGQETASAQQTTMRGGKLIPGAGSTFNYSVNPDCTGSQSGFPAGSGVFAQLAVIHDGSEGLAIATGAGLNVAVHYERMDDELTRRADHSCSVATLNGAYGVMRSGEAAHGHLTTVGVASFDGQGMLSINESVAAAGITSDDPNQFFTYSVAPDCTGTLRNETGDVGILIIVHDGGQVLGMSTVPGTNVAMHFERMTDPTRSDPIGRPCRDIHTAGLAGSSPAAATMPVSFRRSHSRVNLTRPIGIVCRQLRRRPR